MTRQTPSTREVSVTGHAHPAVLIDRAGARGPDTVSAIKLVAADDAPFGAAAPDGTLPAAALVETLAQAALRLAGGEAAATSDAEPGAAAAPSGPGLLVACDGVRVAQRPVPGDRLRIEVTVLRRFGDLIQVGSRATLEAEAGRPALLVAEGTFTLRRGSGHAGEES
jgi:acyl dehydratase